MASGGFFKRFGLILIVAAGAALRLVNFLQNKSLWGDEFFTVELLQRSVPSAFLYVLHDVHAPLYYMLERIWLCFFGDGALSARFLSMIFSIAIIPAVYRAGKAAANEETGLIAALLTAVSPYHLQMANEAREYALAGLTGTLVIAAFYSLEKGKTLFYRITAVTGVYLHHYFWPMGAALFLASRKFTESWKRNFQIYIPAAIAGFPMLCIMVRQAIVSEKAFDAQRLAAENFSLILLAKKWLGLLIHFGSGYYISHVSIGDIPLLLRQDIWASLILLTAIPCAAAVFFRAWKHDTEGKIRLAILLFLLLATFLSFAYPIRASARYFACFSSFFFIITAYGLVSKPGILKNVLFLIFVLLNLGNAAHMLMLKTDPIHREDYKQLSVYLSEKSRAGDVITGSRSAIEYYLCHLNLNLSASFTETAAEIAAMPQSQRPARVWIAFYGDKEPARNESFWKSQRDILSPLGYSDSGEILRFGGALGFNYLYRFDRNSA